MFKKIVIVGLSFLYLNAAPQDELSSLKEKNEIIALKEELTVFYNKKEADYQKNKQELEQLLKKIEKEKKDVEELNKQNEIILKDIQGEVETKTAKIYDRMKPKIAATIFNQMMDEGKVEDVFDIILKLKESNVTILMKFLNVEHASLLTEKLKNYNSKKEQ
jgi:flagellar motility protein MotE (MotC chaperone)